MNLFKALNDKEDGLFNIFPFLFQDDSCGEEFTKEAEDFLLDVMFIDDSIMISILSRLGCIFYFIVYSKAYGRHNSYRMNLLLSILIKFTHDGYEKYNGNRFRWTYGTLP